MDKASTSRQSDFKQTFVPLDTESIIVSEKTPPPKKLEAHPAVVVPKISFIGHPPAVQTHQMHQMHQTHNILYPTVVPQLPQEIKQVEHVERKQPQQYLHSQTTPLNVP